MKREIIKLKNEVCVMDVLKNNGYIEKWLSFELGKKQTIILSQNKICSDLKKGSHIYKKDDKYYIFDKWIGDNDNYTDLQIINITDLMLTDAKF